MIILSLGTIEATSRRSSISAFTASYPVVSSTCPQTDSELESQHTGISGRKLTKPLHLTDYKYVYVTLFYAVLHVDKHRRKKMI